MRKGALFLRDALKDGPKLAAEVIANGEAAGFDERALRRALKKLGGTSEKPSFGTGWVWEFARTGVVKGAGVAREADKGTTICSHTKAVRFVRFVRSKRTRSPPKGTKGTKFVFPARARLVSPSEGTGSYRSAVRNGSFLIRLATLSCRRGPQLLAKRAKLAEEAHVSVTTIDLIH